MLIKLISIKWNRDRINLSKNTLEKNGWNLIIYLYAQHYSVTVSRIINVNPLSSYCVISSPTDEGSVTETFETRYQEISKKHRLFFFSSETLGSSTYAI